MALYCVYSLTRIQHLLRLRMILLARVFHWSLDVITASLKVAARDGMALIDPCGNVHNCYTPLIMYIVDLPEQQLIAVLNISYCCGLFTDYISARAHYHRVHSTIVPSVACQTTEGEYHSTNPFLPTNTL